MAVNVKNITVGSATMSARFSGPEDGVPVLCLHGFPDTALSYRHQEAVFAAAGYRVIVPTLPGYEPGSLSEDGRYFLPDLADMILAFLDQVAPGQKVHIIGHDWGAYITFLCAIMAPDRFYCATQMAVPHPIRMREALKRVPKQILNSWYIFFFQLPRLPEWRIKRQNFSFLEWIWRKWSPGWAYEDEAMDDLKRAFSDDRVLDAALHYYRDTFDLKDERAQRNLDLSAQPNLVPTLGLAGALDGCIDAQVFAQALQERDFPGGLKVDVIDGCGHFLHQELPDVINPILLEWLKKHEV